MEQYYDEPKIRQLNRPELYNSFYWLNDINVPHPDSYFVFGSNLKGVHGAGAAKQARMDFGAQLGVGVGYTGKSYAIPTKDHKILPLDLDTIGFYIRDFVEETKRLRNHFYVTPVGCGLAGFKPDDIAPMFQGCVNCYFPYTWKTFLW